MGRAIPGHTVEVVDEKGTGSCRADQLARWPSNVPTRSCSWNTGGSPRPPGQVRRRLVSHGDLAEKDQDGYIWFKGRTDDLITSAGYRIGPAEIEDCLIEAQIRGHGRRDRGTPDPVRGDIVKAFIVVKPEVTPSPALEEEIKDFVKDPAGASRISPGDRFRQRASHDHDRQDHAPGTEKDGY